MGFFSDSLVDPTGLAGQNAANLKRYTSQPDYGYSQVRAPVVNQAFDAAAKRYQDAIINRQKNLAAESGWGIKATQRGPAASRISKGFQELETDRAMAELGQQNQWQNFVANQVPSAISSTQKVTPGVASQLLSPFVAGLGRELAPGAARGLVDLGKTGYEGLRDWGWGGGAKGGEDLTTMYGQGGEGFAQSGGGAEDIPWDWGNESVDPSALADLLPIDEWDYFSGGF